MADGLLSSALGAIDRTKQALGARFGLLVDNPEEFARQLAAEARQRAGVGLLGEPKTAEEMASGAWINSPYGMQAMQAGSGFAGSIAPKYGLMHRPMTVEGGAARLHEASKAFGDDVYGKNALQYFGSGLTGEQTSLNILKNVRGNPEAEITIYRGVPKGVKTINEGDWVTLDPKMAAEYGNVVSKKVKVKDITTWPDSLVEFGYYPSK
jgi:hypothetical protein